MFFFDTLHFEVRGLKIHVLHCGSIRVSETVPFGGKIDLRSSGRRLLTPTEKRITLPVCVYLVEHPKGLLLVDTGWCREISPDGVYDEKAVKRVLPGYLAAFYRPSLPAGMGVHEQLADMGVRPEDLEYVILSHLDPDHTAGLRHVCRARRILLPEDEYFWSCRAVYKVRQPQKLWIEYPMERRFYRGSPLGPNHWVIDLFGDGSVQLVNVPGHTDGQAATLLRGRDRFVILAADAAFSPRNWQEGITPGFGFDRWRQQKSLIWLREMAEDPRCAAILCSHDPAVRPQTIEI